MRYNTKTMVNNEQFFVFGKLPRFLGDCVQAGKMSKEGFSSFRYINVKGVDVWENRAVIPEIAPTEPLRLIISGPSGVGKDVTIQGLSERLNIPVVKTCTTRPQRDEEKDNDPYTRMTQEEFEQAIAATEFEEYVNYDGYYYGTRKEDLKSDQPQILRVDPRGAVILSKTLENCIYIFMIPESLPALAKRLIKRDIRSKKKDNRSEARAKAKSRWEKLRGDLALIYEAQYIVENRTGMQEETVLAIQEIIEKNLAT